MTVDKIGTIFQVNANTLYITDDANTAIFPESSGNFLYINLSHRGHYEVHGDPIHAQSVGGQHGAQPAVPFSFMRRASAPASTGVSQPGTSRQSRPNMFPAKDFQRAVHIGEVMSGKITSSRTVVIRFTESEATVDHITAKVKEALGCEDSLTLTDSQGNEIIDSHATRILITGNKTQGKYMLFTMRSSSSGEVGGRTKQDDLKHAAESLPDITEAIRVLSDIAKRGAQEATLTLARDSQLSCV
uniref:Uncharacterized protein n=1 Tax=Knipowitschia caucasica TaxID=637954 RepID=A0AAV2L8A0_KNICA